MTQAVFGRRPDPADPVLEEATVLRLARRHLPSVSAVTAIDETGGEARAYVIDERYIFKTQRPHRLRSSTSLEKAALHEQLIAHEFPDVSIPRVLGYGRDGEIEYVLETRMAGVAIRDVALEGEARRAVLFELGKTLRRIHSVDLLPFERSGLFPGDKDELDVQRRLERSLAQACEAIAAQPELWTLELPLEVAVARVQTLVQDGSRAPLHTNPGPEHVFVDPATLRFTGIIDFGDAYISHPAIDLRRWSNPSDRAALLQGYRAESDVSDAFVQTSRAVIISGLMQTVARWGQRRDEALADLASIFAEAT
ncbi:MAG: aminoglycoside phosphotransferase family protein [Dehalococcoidia bacterium]|nr:aminoglycoside phosphotransferase family protein [Dehalococcoidia bacterium]